MSTKHPKEHPKEQHQEQHQEQARDLETGLAFIKEEKVWADISDVAVVWDLESGRVYDKHYRELDRKEYEKGKIVIL